PNGASPPAPRPASIDGPSALGVGKTKVDVDVDPWVYMVGIGYKF
ncbi:MAG: hypothetical protein H5U33_23735, partial [Pseudomonas sp.]|nr:hypothetical protein [Pseudomonas sp.]